MGAAVAAVAEGPWASEATMALAKAAASATSFADGSRAEGTGAASSGVERVGVVAAASGGGADVAAVSRLRRRAVSACTWAAVEAAREAATAAAVAADAAAVAAAVATALISTASVDGGPVVTTTTVEATIARAVAAEVASSAARMAWAAAADDAVAAREADDAVAAREAAACAGEIGLPSPGEAAAGVGEMASGRVPSEKRQKNCVPGGGWRSSSTARRRAMSSLTAPCIRTRPGIGEWPCHGPSCAGTPSMSPNWVRYKSWALGIPG
jgi:hypothetical protein